MIRDPAGMAGGGRRAADEALRVGEVGGGQHPGPAGLHGCDPAVVDIGGGVQAEAAVAMLVVVPGEEFLAVRAGGLDGGEPGGEAGPVLEGLELGFGVGVVVALTG